MLGNSRALEQAVDDVETTPFARWFAFFDELVVARKFGGDVAEETPLEAEMQVAVGAGARGRLSSRRRRRIETTGAKTAGKGGLATKKKM